MITKVCAKCGVEKPLDEFHRKSQARDGHRSACKTCASKYERSRQRDRTQYNREWRDGSRETLRDRERRYAEENKGRLAELKRDRREDRPHEYRMKERARHQLHQAVARGDITRKPCEVCGSESSIAHHDDYDKPLDVRWLCIPHHNQLHNMKHQPDRTEEPS